MKGEKTTITYDSLGRKTAMDDPQMGYWSYGYDLNGCLTGQTDNKGKVTSLGYDRLNRIVSKNYVGNTSPTDTTDITYNYDSGDYAKGRLSSVQDLSGTTSFTYDKFGRNIQKARNLSTISGTAFSTESEYDALDRETKLIYPDGDHTSYNYDANFLKYVTKIDTYATLGYDTAAVGKISSINYGNTVQTAYTYNPGDQRLNTIITTKSGNTIQSSSYTYDAIGNISAIDDKTTSDVDQGFTYDSLDRLTMALSPNSYAAKYYEYDRTGNMIYNPDSKSAEQSFAFEGDVSNATINGAQYCNGILGRGLSFDGNDTVSISNSDSPQQELSVELWAMRSTGGSGTLVSKSNCFEITCNANGDVIGKIYIGSQAKTVTYTSALTENLWKYVVMTYDGSNLKLFVNAGTPTTLSATGNIHSNTSPIILGTNYSGRIDELNIWGRTLTANEISIKFEAIPNRAPNQPYTAAPIPSDFCSGVSGTQYTFKFKGWDVNGDNLTYVIDWDVDNIQDTLDTRSEVSNGTEVQVEHSWTVTQDTSFGIRYKAIDSHGAESSWSPTYYISIGTPKQTALEEPHLFGSAGILQNTSYVATGTIGETTTGKSQNSTYIAYSGYTGGICSNNSLAVMASGQSDPGNTEATPPTKLTMAQLETISGTTDVESAIKQYKDQVVKDKNGNMLISNNRWIKYDYENRPVKIATLATISGTATVLETTDLVYDFEGQRIFKTISQNGSEVSKTLYIGTVFEQTGSEETKYMYAGSQRIAMKNQSGTVSYFHSDHLGSTHLMTNATTGLIVRTNKYFPYGSSFETSGTTDDKHKFTGQVLDDDTNLYYYGARYYDPNIGTFITPDTFIQDSYDPQTLNRYTYCRNNPIKLVDPDGNTPILAAMYLFDAYMTAVAASPDFQTDVMFLAQAYEQYQNQPSFMEGANVVFAAGALAVPGISGSQVKAGRELAEATLHARQAETAVKGVSAAKSEYAGVRQASEYLKSLDVSRIDRKKILESFDVRTIQMEKAGERTFGLRFYDNITAFPKGQTLFETFSGQINRVNLSLPYKWNNMSGIAQWQIREGATYFSGRAASQFSYGSQYIGGAKQFYVPSRLDLRYPY
ncbi:MAG: hypothetical protein A3J83_05335 [Elusimicrobia bacterium RIFOXYA2_FULL_40_6]|nr:MAG: hypothetical protein A3J83_05335 [Elusimicrobia bacterium RIFOXYA2_FULL_40_6]